MNPYTYHRLLLRQIRKVTGSFSDITPADIPKLLDLISTTYSENDKSQERSDRATSLMSTELMELNKKIRTEAQVALEASEHKYRSIVQNISGVVFSHIVRDGKVIPLFLSHDIEALSGYAADDFTLEKITFCSLIHPDDKEHYTSRIQGNGTEERTYEIEYRIINKSGGEVWVFEQGRLREEQGQLRNDGVIINITRQKQAQQELINAASEAREANRAKSEFLSNMSHELRTPMHSILSYAELGSSGIDLKEPIESTKSAFDIIHKSGKRLLSLLDNLLDLAKMEAGKVHYNFKDNDIVKAIVQAQHELAPLVEKKNLRVTLDAPDGIPPISVDRDRIIQVAINLLANAVKFTPPGKEIKIGVENHSASGYLLIRVADQGVGIPPEQMETIFEAFVQSSRTSAGSGGTGLGLSIVKEIVKAHGGRIHATNNPDVGATFTVEIPFKRSVI